MTNENEINGEKPEGLDEVFEHLRETFGDAQQEAPSIEAVFQTKFADLMTQAVKHVNDESFDGVAIVALKPGGEPTYSFHMRDGRPFFHLTTGTSILHADLLRRLIPAPPPPTISLPAQAETVQ